MVDHGGKQHTVSIVDDEDMVLTLGRVILKRHGYRVLVSANGPHAIKICRDIHPPPDCVIVDFTMPGMNGRETLHEIRKVISGIPAILSSGYSGEELSEVMSGIELSGMIQKPYRQEMLVAVLERALAPQRNNADQSGQIIR